MWTYFKTKKLSLLAILAGLTYAFMIVNLFSSDWDSWQMSFNRRALGAEYNKWGDVTGHKPVESYEFFVKAKDGFASFPDSLVNLKNNQTIKAKYAEMSVLVPYSKPEISAMFFVFITIVVLILLIASVRIPIHFYKLIGLIKKEFIFEQKSIRLLRWLGLELLVVYFLSLLGSYVGHQFDCSLFAFSEYELVMESVDPIWLLLGIVTFLIAEILSKALVIKEEQELTI